MRSLGATFRREREARNIPLEEIAAKTRIGIRLLRAIEEERFERLPGGIFNVSFVRQYARCLGLDEEAAVREYLETAGAGREAAVAERARPPQPPVSWEEPEQSRLVLAVVLLGLMAAGMAYGLYRLHAYLTATPSAGERRANQTLARETPPDLAPPPLEGLPEFAAEEESPPPAENPPDGLPAPGGIPATPSAPLLSPPAGASQAGGVVSSASGELSLRIDSHGLVWLSITADGVKQWQGTMRANQSRDVQATESVRLTVGDAAAVALTLNGRLLPALGRPGEVKNLTITARSVPESAP